MNGRLIAIGDSITKGTYREGVAKPCFAELLKEKFGFDELFNYGHNGTSVSTLSPTFPEHAMSVYVDEMAQGDCVIVAGGTNDYGASVELGTPKDIEDVSFYGALTVLYRKLAEKYKSAKIFIVTPIRRKPNGPNKKGYTLEDYRQAIAYRAKEYGFYLIHGDKMPIDPYLQSDTENYISDGLHPNTAGHAIYAEFLGKEIRRYVDGEL